MKTETVETRLQKAIRGVKDHGEVLGVVAARRAGRAAREAEKHRGQLREEVNATLAAAGRLGTPQAMAGAFAAYLRDAAERSVLMADLLRRRGDIFVEHEAAGCPPVLIYDYEVVMQGRDLPRPCNYMLLRILPPAGMAIDDRLRPYMIIDPRAGHGPGIGGFKKDSQVGVALKAGHPVYFVAFHRLPEPGQTIAHVTEAEAAFLREIERRHPEAERAVVVGNCQGGWATAILAALNPDLAGPIVLNGAPMSYWGGKVGQDLMRYSGGLAGGVTPAMLSSDLAGGLFDGAWLVQNFETMSPGNVWFRKYFDVWQQVDSAKAQKRFLDFETWWGGYFLMTGAEITWIVDELFVGNKLARNQAQIEPGRHVDLKAIRAPVICFASHGDNITPPAQALNWIMDTYADETEIEIRGQRILYMIHEQVGHLGIFVSSSVANREHAQMASTLRTIEALAPGLYEIVIEDVQGEGDAKSFRLSIAPRKFQDIIDAVGQRRDEAAFPPVARISDILANTYDIAARPAVRAMGNPRLGEISRDLHPLRLQRALAASGSPAAAAVERAAAKIAADRHPVAQDNPFRLAEMVWGDLVEAGWNSLRDLREVMVETTFFGIYANPWMVNFGQRYIHERTKKTHDMLLGQPEVQLILQKVEKGGLGEAILRMLVLLAGTRSAGIRQDRLERSVETIHGRAPLRDLDVPDRVRLIHEQTVIAHSDPEAAIASLPKLLATETDRKAALAACRYVLGDEADMEPETRALLARMEALLPVRVTSGAAQNAAVAPDAAPGKSSAAE